MFFQINVTPKTKKDTKSFESNTNDLHFTLVLGPFQPQTRIIMEALVNTTVQCYLNVKNISDKDLNVTVTKKPNEDRHIDLDVSHMTIQSNSNEIVSIKWSPKEAGCWRDVIQFTDSRRIKYDVAVITTAKNTSKKSGKPNKPLVLQPSGQIKNTKRRPYEEKKVLQCKSMFQDNSLSSNRQAKEEIVRSHNIRDKENIVNVDTFYKETTESSEGKYNTSDFQKLIDSSAFNLTVFNTDQKFTPYKRDHMNHMPSIPSIPEEMEIRRETYVKKEPICSINVTSMDTTNKEIFEDSLSPQNQNISSEFSMLINNLAPNVMESSSHQYKAPIKSTPICNNYIENGVETTSVQTDGNGTYNLSPLLSINSPKNFNINTISNRSPDTCTKTKDFVFCHPKNFNSSSPISSVKNEWAHTPCAGVLPSSSPIPFTLNPDKLCYSARYTDPVTAKDVLEADMWVKGNDYCNKNLQVRRNINFGSTATEGFSGKCEGSVLNKTQTFNMEKSSGVCIEISPPKRSFYSKMPLRKISPKKGTKIMKERFTYEGMVKKKVHANVPVKKSTSVSMPGVRITKLSLKNVVRPKHSDTVSDQPKETYTKLQDTDNLFTKFCNPDPFAACVTEDPFLSSTTYYDEKWVQNQEIAFKKWLNALLSPPEDLNTDVESSCVDIGKVWQSCKLMENSILAETKETLSARYHTDLRLNALRKAAGAMYRRNEIVHVLSRTTVCIEKGTLTIRLDRDLHRDIGLQKEMLELFLSYNPLWLRIGLETIYGEKIPLHSNNDLVGLTRFLLTRYFSDPSLKSRYPHAYHRKQQELAFITQMNKFMLKKFLFLVYFLDYSKINKLIRHDPCLFHKKANIKDSRSILLAFSRSVLSGIGDVTKVLRSYEYVVSYKQTCLDEFDYAVISIQQDLRDGVRLCRVMELISGQSDLTHQCRMPTISRLQKIHNVDVALKALLQCGYILTGNIDAKSIADGHREKTLSLLWQIIYKYQAPRFEKAAQCLQKWWRALLWYIRTKNYTRMYKHNAACVIQRAWRSTLARRKLNLLREEYMRELQRREEAARFLQNRWRHLKRGVNDRTRFLYIKLAVIKLQKWWRRVHECRPYTIDFKNTREASIIVQRQWRAIRAMRAQRIIYNDLRNASVLIQTLWRAKLSMRINRARYLKYRNAVVFVQDRWRFKKLYFSIKKQRCVKTIAVCKIKVWWSSILIMRRERNNFLIMKDAANTIKIWWASVLQRKRFLATRRAAIIIQKNWRRMVARNEYLKKKAAVAKIERWYECIIARRNFRNSMLIMKNAALCIQAWWRNVSITRKQRAAYLEIREAVLTLQKRWRMIIHSRKIRQEYLSKKRACVTIQAWWRMIKAKERYKCLLYKRNTSAIILQRKWRSTLIMRKCKEEYIQLKLYTINIQRRWRALQSTKQELKKFSALKSSTIHVQRLFRANKLCYHTRQWYIRLKQSTILVQSHWKMKLTRRRFVGQKKAALTIQSHWRAYKTGKVVRTNYELLKSTTIKIQRRYRSNKIGRKLAEEYKVLRKTVVCLQIRWRAKLLGRSERRELETYHCAAKTIQMWWWRILFVKKCKFVGFNHRNLTETLSLFELRQICQNTVVSVIKIQRWWRVVRQKRLDHEKRVRAVRVIENWRIAILEIRKKIRASTIIKAAWKGYKVRLEQSDRMSEVRQRLITATKAATPSATLGYRCQKMIGIFKKCENIGQLSMCFASLGIITRLSPKECVILCENNLVECIYETYGASNRSLPWTMICLRAASILITLAKFVQTKSYVSKPRYALPTVKLLHDKLENKELSLNVATLIWLLVDEEEYKQALKSSQVLWLLNSIYRKVIKRKEKLAYYSEILRRQSDLFPNCKPDWLILQKQNTRIFTTIEHAVTAIIERLEINKFLA